MEAYKDAFKHYVNWRGRTSRKGYWLFVLMNTIVIVLLQIIDQWVAVTVLGFPRAEIIAEIGIYPFTLVYALIILIPEAMISIRRLHDTNRSGWWLLVGIIPVIGSIVLLVFYCLASDQNNRFGRKPDPQLTS